LAQAAADARAEELPALEEAARIAAANAEQAWEPRSVPLPTYVTPPSARRPQRTIELASGARWVAVPATSEPTAPQPAAPQPAADDADAPRAVNE
ncbi:MAG: hypothetical protein M3P96_16230, partial [Actinomycetota bacterium]|nr:hypothetical protein [Actinomycetota bacterium]